MSQQGTVIQNMTLSHPILAMNPELTFPDREAPAARSVPAFAIRSSPTVPGYHELVLGDAHGSVAYWVISEPLKYLAKRPVLLWRLSATIQSGSLSCVETAPVQFVSADPGTASDLRGELAQGTLRLAFSGQLLRGYYRLHCLPTGGGQMWQLTPISRV